jgi:hypothetical protein
MDITQAGRLLTLAYYLKTEVKPEFFDMSCFGQKWFETVKETPVKTKALGIGQTAVIEAKHVCKTSACALGWATVVFPETFRLDWGYEYELDPAENDEDDPLEASVQIKKDGEWRSVSYERHQFSDWGEMVEIPGDLHDFFGITNEEAWELFGGNDATPKQKAKQIEELVDHCGYTYAK